MNAFYKNVILFFHYDAQAEVGTIAGQVYALMDFATGTSRSSQSLEAPLGIPATPQDGLAVSRGVDLGPDSEQDTN